jgi:nucleotide-binding universal stress UspA family protein
MFKTILAAIDGSKHAEKALALATELAQKHRARLILLTVYSQDYVPEVSGIGMVASFPTDSEQEREAAENVLAQADEQAERAGFAGAETIVRKGDAASQILEVAESEGVDTIILGSHGHGTLVGLLVGSVSTKVTAHAKCTCITVR